MAEAYARSGSQVYMYKYQYLISSSPYDRIYGLAVHTSELPIVFAEALSNKVIINKEKNGKKRSNSHFQIELIIISKIE